MSGVHPTASESQGAGGRAGAPRHRVPSATAHEVAALLDHPDPPQLWFQIGEIVDDRTYLRGGVEVGEGDVVFDVGANAGVAAVFFAHVCGAGVVHSFEPVRPIFEVLRRNVAGLDACRVHPYGLAAGRGIASITYYPRADAMSGLYADPDADRLVAHSGLTNIGVPDSEARARLEGSFEPRRLPCELRTLSQALAETSTEAVDLLKIDVEKAELEVLRGIGRRDWPRIRQISMEVHDDSGRAALIAEMLERRGFSVNTEQDPAMRGTALMMLYAVRE